MSERGGAVVVVAAPHGSTKTQHSVVRQLHAGITGTHEPDDLARGFTQRQSEIHTHRIPPSGELIYVFK